MKKQKAIVMQLLLFLLIITACKKEELNKDTLPPITQEGLNTFGCLINGEVLIPKDYRSNLFTNGRQGLSIFINKKYLSIWAGNYANPNGNDIYIYIPELYSDGEGEYFFELSNGKTGVDSPSFTHLFAHKNPLKDSPITYLSYQNSGKIIINRFDTLNTIISGVFYLKVLNQNEPFDTLEINEGRFDINWSTLNQD